MLRLAAHPAGAATRAEVAVAARRRGDGALLLDYRLVYPAGRGGAIGEPDAAGGSAELGAAGESVESGDRAPTLQIPAAGSTLPADRLWAYTCFEAFVGRAGEVAYREFNFSPSGQWAGWTFSDYRQRDDAAPALPAPQLDWWRAGDGVLPVDAAAPAVAGKPAPLLVLRAVLPAAALPAGDSALQLGMSAVVVRADGDAAYFALRHPVARPDFHHRAGFVLSLPA